MEYLLIVVYIAIILLVVAGMWGLFSKAGKPGWYSLIPILNTVAIVNIAGRPSWWFFLTLIPLVNIVVVFLIYHDISKAFGYGIGTTLGLLFLPFIFVPLIGLGGAYYTRPNTGVPA